ncbi:MAG: hypothetical protein WBC27_08365 [Candidatus Nanopelagicales bacterium]
MDPRDALAAMLAAALVHLQHAAGDTSMCDLSRTGSPVPALKYREGAWAALAEVRRKVGPDLDTTVTTATSTLQQWSAELDRARFRGSGANWLAYRTGGVDALNRLMEAVQAPPVALPSDGARDGHEVVDQTFPG